MRDAAMTWTGRCIEMLPNKCAKDGFDFSAHRRLCAKVSETDRHFIGNSAVTRAENLFHPTIHDAAADRICTRAGSRRVFDSNGECNWFPQDK